MSILCCYQYTVVKFEILYQLRSGTISIIVIYLQTSTSVQKNFKKKEGCSHKHNCVMNTSEPVTTLRHICPSARYRKLYACRAQVVSWSSVSGKVLGDLVQRYLRSISSNPGQEKIKKKRLQIYHCLADYMYRICVHPCIIITGGPMIKSVVDLLLIRTYFLYYFILH